MGLLFSRQRALSFGVSVVEIFQEQRILLGSLAQNLQLALQLDKFSRMISGNEDAEVDILEGFRNIELL